MTIIGVDVDAAVEPILTLFSGNNSAGSGVSETFLNNGLYYCSDYNYVIAQLCMLISSSLLCF